MAQQNYSVYIFKVGIDTGSRFVLCMTNEKSRPVYMGLKCDHNWAYTCLKHMTVPRPELLWPESHTLVVSGVKDLQSQCMHVPMIVCEFYPMTLFEYLNDFLEILRNVGR